MSDPGFVQHVSSSNTNTANAATAFKVQLPGVSQAGNCIIVVVTYDNTAATTASVTDDKGNSYSAGPVAHDATNNRFCALFFALNVAASTRVITAAFSGTGIKWASVVASEFFNVATVAASDGSNNNAGANGSTTASAGSITPSQSGDLFYQFVYRSQTPSATSFTAGSQANITWLLASADLLDGHAVQYGVYNSTSALNPQMTLAAGSGYVSVAIALKAASAGSPIAAGMQAQNIVHLAVPTSRSGSSPLTFQFPCSGNLLVLSATISNSTNTYIITGITDSKGNIWTQTAQELHGPTGSGSTDIWFAENAISGSDLVIAVATANGGGTEDQAILLYDIAGAATSRVYKCRQASSNSDGSSVPASGPFTPFSAYPATDSGIAIVNMSIATNTVNALSAPSGALLDSHTYTGEAVDGPQPIDQNNGFGHVPFSSASQQTYTWDFVAAASISNYACSVAFFRAPNAAQYPGHVQTISAQSTGVGATVAVTIEAQAAGHVLAIGCGRGVTSGATITAADSAGNAITAVDGPTTITSLGQMKTFYVKSCKAGVTTITITFADTTSTTRSVWVSEFMNCDTLDQHALRTTTGDGSGNYNSGTVAIAAAGEIVFGHTWCTSQSSVGSTFAFGARDGVSSANVSEWKIVTVQGSYSADFHDTSASANEGASIMTFFLAFSPFEDGYLPPIGGGANSLVTVW